MKKKRNVFIFGAGQWGRTAYAYYSRRCNVVGYIDNDDSIWETKLDGLPVCSPDILQTQDCTVVIAVKRYVDDIKYQLFRDYGIKKVVIFSPMEFFENTVEKTIKSDLADELIVKFYCGLGNQMFQYVIYKICESQGKKVRADISEYIISHVLNEEDSFLLTEIFPNIKIKECTEEIKKYFVNNAKQNDDSYVYEEPFLPLISFDISRVLNMKVGIIKGFFQSYKYSEIIEECLRKDFEFCDISEKKVQELIKEFDCSEYISVHIRRGDYLDRTAVVRLGRLYDTDYYEKAIGFMKSKLTDAKFIFFSDDIEWVKKNYQMENAIYVDKKMFQSHEDWYDMCLMSHCKHNIIANSTFSWWGAWLNSNPNKIVIAPKQWTVNGAMQDICPPKWIRM